MLAVLRFLERVRPVCRSVRYIACFAALLAAMLPSLAWAEPQELPPPIPQALPPEIVGPTIIPADPLVPYFDPYFSEENPNSQWPGGLPLDGYGRDWTWQFLPEGLIYRSYLAGPRESRFASVWAHERDLGWLWDVTLGGRVGVYRYGTTDSFRPEGWQLDIEGAALPRLDWENEQDVVSTDFRFGIPLTHAFGAFEAKLAYYHLSSHLGDEFLLKNPGIRRVNYSRDAFVLGLAAYATDHVRFYGEAGYSFANSGGSEPWEFQFGAELSPVTPNYVQGAPFAAVNAHLREEVDFSGTLTVQAGWQWRGYGSHHLFRLGAQYLTGKSPQFQFHRNNEEQIAFALWYDY